MGFLKALISDEKVDVDTVIHSKEELSLLLAV
jgi:hypothetical protein